ncbi:MAG: peptide/nickel transport system permease protein [Actinomycetota bacterium]|jgi:ABC-type dipeptide/oligopeptide/nickel transport system permease subunit|nr:peptide/nickel transport system permease protein [Actinomycetota bacterium]
MADAALPPTVGPPGVGEVTLEAGATGFGSAETQASVLGIRVQTQFGDIWRRFLRNKLAVVGLVMVSIVFLTAVLAPLLAPHEPKAQDLSATLGSPSASHWLGTDDLGRDQLSRVIYGSRIAVTVGLATILLALVIGIILGSLSGYLGGAWDAVIMRVADVFFAFPLLIGAIVIVLVVGRGLTPVILALGIFSWATVARLLRSSILSVRESEYVEAARSLGAGKFRIVTRHVLPNSMAPVLVFAMVSVATAIVAEASLSYLGVGLPPDVPDWGNMIASGQKFFGYKDFLWFFPSMAVVFTVLGFVFVGDGLRDALDPRLR